MKDISKKIKMLNDRILIKEQVDDKEKKTSSGIFIPANSDQDKSGKRGVVIAVGTGKVNDDGKIIPLTVKADDLVIFQWGDKVNIDGQEYYVVKESEILAIIK